MKMILTPATSPDEYVARLTSWQRSFTEALRETVVQLAIEAARPSRTPGDPTKVARASVAGAA